MAHEHFHAHFQSMGLKVEFEGLEQEEEVQFNKEVIIRGWNEGLADFYAYVYTGRAEFMTVSLSDQARRKLTQETLPLRDKDSLYQAFREYDARDGNVLGCLSYPMGTQIATFLYNIVQLEVEGTESENAKMWMERIFNALKGKPQVLAASVETLEPKLIMEWIFNDETQLNHQQTELLQKFTTEAPYVEIRRAYPCRR